MTPARRTRLAVLTLLLLPLGSAPSGSQPSPFEAAHGSRADRDTESRLEPAGPSAGERSPGSGPEQLSPLDAALGSELSPAEMSRAYGAAVEGWANSVTDCLAAEGFGDFVQSVPETPDESEFRPIATAWDLDLAADGYGVAAGLRNVGAGVGAPDARTGDPYFAAMSDSEFEAFARSYNDCSAEAAARHPFPGQLPDEILRLRQDFESGLAGSVEMASIWSEWSSCMAEDGYSFTDRADAIAALHERASPILAELDTHARQAAASGGRFDPPAEVMSRVDEIEGEEERVVAADLACTDSLDLDSRALDVRLEQEAAFVEENGDRIAVLLAEQQET